MLSLEEDGESQWNTNIRNSYFCRVCVGLDFLESLLLNTWMHPDRLLIINVSEFMLRHCQQAKEKSSVLNMYLDEIFLLWDGWFFFFSGKTGTLRETTSNARNVWTLLPCLVVREFLCHLFNKLILEAFYGFLWAY